MRRTPSLVPNHDDREIYLVLDDFGERMGRSWRETDEENTDRATVIADLIDGQYSNPVRVVSFDTAEGWSRDVSEEIAGLIAYECGRDGFDIPPSLESFVERHGNGRVTQLALPLRGAA
jgi:hypothetical protein